MIFQHLPIKEKTKNIEVYRLRIGCIIDTLLSIDIEGIIKAQGKMIRNYKSVFNRMNFKISPFRKIIEKLFALKQEYKDEGDDLMQNLIKLIMNSLYGVQIRKDVNELLNCKSELWMQTEYEDKVSEHWKLSNGN